MKILKYLKKPSLVIKYLKTKRLAGKYGQSLGDEEYLKKAFKLNMGKELNLDHPQTFNEKLQWLKLYDRKPEYTVMVDKDAVKQYVAKKIGEKYIIPTLGVWDEFNDIDFETLPNQFVLKCTHDSGGLVICRDKSKLDLKTAKKQIERSLKRDYYLVHREWPYKDVPRKIIAEKYMVDESGTELKDYKFFCFDGKVKCSFVGSNRFSKEGLNVTFFDREWRRLPFERQYKADKNELKKPQSYEKMIELAEKLSKNISFLRVDFYEINGQIYFGELTFYPGSGYEKFSPEEWDYKLGEWIKLPERKS